MVFVPRFTAKGGGYFKVFVNGLEHSKHLAEREAEEEAGSVKLINPEMKVEYTHQDYLVEVTLVDILPDPVSVSAPVIQVSFDGNVIQNGDTITLGELQLNEEVNFEIEIVNAGDANLVINANTVLPNKSLKVLINAQFDTSVAGLYNQEQTVESNDPNTPIFIFNVSYSVLLVVVTPPPPPPQPQGLLDPSKLVYIGAIIVEGGEDGSNYSNTAYSRSEIDCVAPGVIQIENHSYQNKFARFQLPEELLLSIPAVQKRSLPAIARRMEPWKDPFDGLKSVLIQQTADAENATPGLPAATQRHVGFNVGGENGIASIYNFYNVSLTNIPSIYLKGSKLPLKQVVGPYIKGYRSCEFACQEENGTFIIGASEFANRYGQSQGPAAFEIVRINENTVDCLPLVYYDHQDDGSGHEFVGHTEATRWTCMDTARNSLFVGGWVPTGVDTVALNREKKTATTERQAEIDALLAQLTNDKTMRWGYGIPPSDACTNSKGYWATHEENRIAFYDLPAIRANRDAGGKPWGVDPYHIMVVSDVLWKGRCAQIGGVTWDESKKRLYVCERAAYQWTTYSQVPVVHVFELV